MRTRSMLILLVLVAFPAFGLRPYLVKDINPVPGPADSAPDSFAALGSVALFSADDGLTGRELWRSDGTAAGTLQLADLATLKIGELWLAVGDVLYFTAEDEAHGLELWRSDGTPAGTWLVTDLRPGPEGSNPQSMVEFKGRVYFSADDGSTGGALWQTDGTPAGTFRLAPHTLGGLIRAGSRVFFAGFSRDAGTELWAVEEAAP